MKKKQFLAGGFILLVLMVSCKNKKAALNPADQIRSYPVTTLVGQDAELQTVFPVIIKGQEDVDIKPRVDGFIEAVYVDEGSMVTKGQSLFKINSPASVQAIENAQANYNNARLDLERMRPLADKGIISKVRISAYENALTSAKAALEQAKATVSWATVISPVDGIVGAINYRQGSLVNNSNVLTTVANTTNVIAYFSMNEKDLFSFMRIWEGKNQSEKIKNMPPVKLLLSDGSVYEEKGHILTISGVVDANSGAVTIRAGFPNKQGLLRSGTSGKIVIPRTLKDALLIPQKATFSQQDKQMVFKVQGDSVVQKVITVKPTADSKNYVVLDGLVAGDRIVTDGIVTLKNGKKIKVQ